MAANRKSISGLETHLGYWLRYVSNQVSHAFALKVRDAGVTVAEWVVLRELYDAVSMPSALAGRLGLTRGAISKLADRLEAKGLIEREATAGDGRVQILSPPPRVARSSRSSRRWPTRTMRNSSAISIPRFARRSRPR